MDTLDLGKIPEESITKVKVALKANAPKAMSVYSILQATTIKQKSLERILIYLEMTNLVERVTTTSGLFWRWRGNDNGN